MSEETFKRIRQLGLMENPFANYRDSRYFVPVNERKTLFQRIYRMATGELKGRLALIMGEDGSGKTILSRRLGGSSAEGSFLNARSVLVSSETISTPTAFLIDLNAKLGLPSRRSLSDRLDLLKEWITTEAASGRGLFLVVDTRINLDIAATLHDVLTWKLNRKVFMPISMALFSDQTVFTLEDNIKGLSNFVEFRDSLGNLSPTSAMAMINGRVTMAGRSSGLFTDEALLELADASNGHPRTAIQIANQSFNELLDSNKSVIDIFMISSAIKALKSET